MNTTQRSENNIMNTTHRDGDQHHEYNTEMENNIMNTTQRSEKNIML